MTSLTSGISHVGLTVADINKTVGFFEAIGFKKVGGSEAYPSVFLSDGSTMITVWKAKAASPVPFHRTANIGLHHLALKVSTREALDKVFKIISDIDGVKTEFGPQPIEGTGMTHCMCTEPCGVRIEFAHHAT